MSIEANSMSEEKIMAALEAGDFAVSYIAPSCVEERKHIDGSSYYIVSAFSGSCFNGDRGGVRLTVCGVVYTLDYSEECRWDGPYTGSKDLICALCKRVIHAWGWCIEPSTVMAVYKRSMNLIGAVEWFVENDFELDGIDDFLDDATMRYKFIDLWLKLQMSGERRLAIDVSMNPYSIVHWLNAQYYKGDGRARKLLVDFMRVGICIPYQMCSDEDYYPPTCGNPYPPELYIEAGRPKIDGDGGRVLTQDERKAKRFSKGF